ncbi:MAG: gluconokinase [Flavitalea sp.]
MRYILGIDIGTTNTKAVSYSEKGNLLAHANVSNTFKAQSEGVHEADPEGLCNEVIKVIKEAVNLTKDHELAGICFSAAMHGLIAVDENGKPLTNMITWADLRSKAYAAKLKNTELGTRLYERTGTPIHPMSPLCKLMWMKDAEPEIFNKAHKFISIKEFIFFKFFGKYIIDHSIASATGLFDVINIDWNKEALEVAGITADKLSEHQSVLYILTGLKGDYAKALGIEVNTPFILGGSDGCLAHLGSNALKKNEVSLTIGTSGAVRMMTEKPSHDTLQRVFNYLLTDDKYISGGPVNNGGNVLQWFAMSFLGKKIVAGEEYDWYVKEAMKVEPGCNGLVFLPYIYGERAPVWDADARGVFFGMSGTHTQSHFMRAVLEGVCFALYGILKTLEEVIGKSENIFVSGGFIHSKPWVSMLSDIFGKQLFVSGSEDASAAGAAIIGLQALGSVKDLADAPAFFTVTETYQPDMKNHEAYKNNYSVYSSLYDKLKGLK